MASIFVSYRRDDAAGFAGRVEDELERRFGDVEVFRDVDDIASGEDFVRRLDHALQSCRVFVAVIGKTWLTARNADGTRRLDDPNDFVRQEISAALRRDVRVIPVLVDGARMPAEADLPEGLKSLARRQAHELSDSRWDYDMGRLASTVEETLGPQPKPKPAKRRWLATAAAVVALAIAGVAGWHYASGPPDLDGTWDLPNGSYWIVEQAGRDLTIQEVHYDSREVWFIDPVGRYLEKALHDVRMAIARDGVPWFARLADPNEALRVLLEEDEHMGELWGFGRNPSPIRNYLTG